MSDVEVALGIDVGGTKILAAIVATDGTVVEAARASTPLSGGREILEAVLAAVDELEWTRQKRPLLACGVGTAGVVVRNRVVSANSLLPGWARQPLGEELEARLRCPITVMNDVHAAAFGELRRGAARGVSSALFVAVGTGVGGALALGGEVAEGRLGIAGSLGHVPAVGDRSRMCPCGVRGHVEAYAGGRGIEQSYSERTGHSGSLRAIAERAHEGELVAREVIIEAAGVLGHAIGGASNLLDPELVVLGGGVPEIGALYLDAVGAAMRSESMRPEQAPLVTAALGGNATVVGAALRAVRLAAGT